MRRTLLIGLCVGTVIGLSGCMAKDYVGYEDAILTSTRTYSNDDFPIAVGTSGRWFYNYVHNPARLRHSDKDTPPIRPYLPPRSHVQPLQNPIQ